MVPIRRHVPFISAGLFCLPLLIPLSLFLIVMVLVEANVRCPYYFHMASLWGMFWFAVSPLFAFTWLALGSISVAMAWFQKGKTRLEIVYTGLCNAVVLLYIGLVVWLLWTKPS